MTTGIIIQARMTSRRFPGKVLALLAGSPVLAHVIERCKLVPGIDMVICAVPSDSASLPISELCRALEIPCVSGPEHDVLERYYGTAQMHDLDTIMRITADCPFVDPIVCGEVLALLKAERLDYCSNVFPTRTYPKGLDCEAFTFDCLEAAHLMSKSAYNREHVTPWMQQRDGIRRACVQQRIDVSNQNWCVDYPEDIPRLEALLQEAQRRLQEKNPLPGVGRPFTTIELLRMEGDNAKPH